MLTDPIHRAYRFAQVAEGTVVAADPHGVEGPILAHTLELQA
jgi:hypothetical protein